MNVSDSLGNAYTSFPNEPVAGSGGAAACWYASNIKSGTNAVKLTFSASVNAYATALEYTGASTVSPFDAEAHSTGGNNAPNSGPGTTSASGDLIFGYGGAINDSGDNRVAGAGFVGRQNNGFLAEDQTANTPGSAAANMAPRLRRWRHKLDHDHG